MEKKAKHKADVWNQKYSEGQKVSLLKDGGEILKMWKVPREVILNALGLHRTKERAWEEI